MRPEKDIKYEPYWWLHAKPYLNEQRDWQSNADVVIIGSGYTGLSAALTLLDKKLKVVVIDSQLPGYGASSRNGGITSGSIKPSFKSLKKRFGLELAKKIVQEGDSLSIITWGAMVQKSIEALKSNEIENGLVEIIDLRTLNPLDFSTIKKSIKKTGKALIVHEDSLTSGPGAEISALLVDHCFENLDGPIKRVGAKDAPIPYNPFLEEEILPHVDDIAFSIIELLEY